MGRIGEGRVLKLKAEDLLGLYVQLDTGYKEDNFHLFNENKDEDIIEYVEEDIVKTNKVVVHPDLAIKIYNEVKNIGEEELKDNYKRMTVINNLSYDYKQEIPKEIEERIWEGNYDKYTEDEISKFIDMYNELN